jgi:hypothetical protein
MSLLPPPAMFAKCFLWRPSHLIRLMGQLASRVLSLQERWRAPGKCPSRKEAVLKIIPPYCKTRVVYGFVYCGRAGSLSEELL